MLSVSTSPVYSTCNGGLSYDIDHVRCPTLCGKKRLPLGSCARICLAVRLYMQDYMEQYSKITCDNIIRKLIYIYINLRIILLHVIL